MVSPSEEPDFTALPRRRVARSEKLQACLVAYMLLNLRFVRQFICSREHDACLQKRRGFSSACKREVKLRVLLSIHIVVMS